VLSEKKNNRDMSFLTLILLTALLYDTSIASTVATELNRRACPYWPFQSFRTVPFHPPILNIATTGAELAKGYLFFGPGPANRSAPPSDGAKQTAPLIMTDTSELVWSGAQGTLSNNLKVQQLDGKPVLTCWGVIELAGTNVGHYYGSFRVLNSSYHEMYRICSDINIVAPSSVSPSAASTGPKIISRRRAPFWSQLPISRAPNWSPIGGPANGTIWDNLFFEINVKTSKIFLSWSAKDHIPISATRNSLGNAGTPTAPFDYFHINSVDPYSGGYLINARHT